MTKMNADGQTQRLTSGCVVIVADAARARFMTVEKDDRGLRLIERRDLVNPEGALSEHERFSDTRKGIRPRAPGAGIPYTFDDGRGKSRDESLRRFARDVGKMALFLLQWRGTAQLAVVASPRFLGLLRPELSRYIQQPVDVTELSEELTSSSVDAIYASFSRHGMVQPRVTPELIYRPSAQHPSARG
jgi:hypothetical protein